jgi:hypothetical protein
MTPHTCYLLVYSDIRNMKRLRFYFCHPIKGYATFIPQYGGQLPYQRIAVDSASNNLVEIPVDNCCEGKWKVVLDWEYENELFVHQKNFEIRKNKVTYF